MRRANSAEAELVTWKRQAGQAYTERLKAKAGANTAGILIPTGSRIDCKMSNETVDGNTLVQCEDGLIYPPTEF